jgi:hypothetical protein
MDSRRFVRDASQRRWPARVRLGLPLSFAISALASGGRGADASRGWCRMDPVLLIDGWPAQVFVAVRLDDLPKVSGATEIAVTTPASIGALHLASTVDFGYGEVVTTAQSALLAVTAQGIEVRVGIHVPATDAVPVRVSFVPRGAGPPRSASAEGTANAWFELQGLLESSAERRP